VLRKTGIAATVLLAGGAFLVTGAAAVTPLSGQYVNVGTAQAQVLPGSRSAYVSITGTIGITGAFARLAYPTPSNVTWRLGPRKRVVGPLSGPKPLRLAS
jgi:hypothetical protein